MSNRAQYIHFQNKQSLQTTEQNRAATTLVTELHKWHLMIIDWYDLKLNNIFFCWPYNMSYKLSQATSSAQIADHSIIWNP